MNISSKVFGLNCSRVLHRLNSSRSSSSKVGYVLGVYEQEKSNTFTATANDVNEKTSGKLKTALSYCDAVKCGKSRVFYGLSDSHPVISVVGLGKEQPEQNLEEWDQKKENIRKAVAAGVKSLSDSGLEKLVIDSCGDAEAAAEGACLANFKYQELKKEQKPLPQVSCCDEGDSGWQKGSVVAASQNVARRLMETPANILTPTKFAQEAVTLLEKLGVEVYAHDRNWAKSKGMEAFLSVAKGSDEPPVFLELNYKGSKDSEQPPLAIVGKGVTFDAGGISIKPAPKMDKMRADMGGAACTLGSIFGAASLKLNLNIRGFIPLCENLPSGRANKPGDVVKASNGLTIQIDNTDAEGRLILADALHYASQFKPKMTIDMATLTYAMMVALGTGATGAFTNSIPFFELLHRAGFKTGDRMWRMPMFEVYEKQVKGHGMADVHNMGKKPSDAGASLAAVFLKQFIECNHWAHLDIAGVMENSDEVPYLGAGMTGRPTRTIIKAAEMIASGEFKG